VYVRPPSVIRGCRAARSGTGRTGAVGEAVGAGDFEAEAEADGEDEVEAAAEADELGDPVDPGDGVAPAVCPAFGLADAPDVRGNCEAVQV
jgi:hypothetical protein